jgi:hypothetical protein
VQDITSRECRTGEIISRRCRTSEIEERRTSEIEERRTSEEENLEPVNIEDAGQVKKIMWDR